MVKFSKSIIMATGDITLQATYQQSPQLAVVGRVVSRGPPTHVSRTEVLQQAKKISTRTYVRMYICAQSMYK